MLVGMYMNVDGCLENQTEIETDIIPSGLSVLVFRLFETVLPWFKPSSAKGAWSLPCHPTKKRLWIAQYKTRLHQKYYEVDFAQL